MLDPDEKWHVDKRFPIVMILGGLVQTIMVVGAFSWWASGMDQRVGQLERGASAQARAAEPITGRMLQLEASQIVVTGKLDSLKEGVQDLKIMMRALAQAPPPARAAVAR